MGAEKDQLCQTGLGEKNVEFDDMDLEAEEIREVLFVTFPTPGGLYFASVRLTRGIWYHCRNLHGRR